MEFFTFIIGALVGAGATQVYHLKFKANVKSDSLKQKAKGGDGAHITQSGRDTNQSDD
jgi:hypothetical protein